MAMAISIARSPCAVRSKLPGLSIQSPSKPATMPCNRRAPSSVSRPAESRRFVHRRTQHLLQRAARTLDRGAVPQQQAARWAEQFFAVRRCGEHVGGSIRCRCFGQDLPAGLAKVAQRIVTTPFLDTDVDQFGRQRRGLASGVEQAFLAGEMPVHGATLHSGGARHVFQGNALPVGLVEYRGCRCEDPAARLQRLFFCFTNHVSLLDQANLAPVRRHPVRAARPASAPGRRAPPHPIAPPPAPARCCWLSYT